MHDKHAQVLAEGQERAKLILMVEDDADIGTFLEQIIVQETFHQPLLVTSGFQALQVIHTITPDLLLLDYQLPGMNGIELYDRLHAMKGLEGVPAIMVSARLPRQELAKRSIVGMSKPLDLDELLETIEQLVA
jgi:DNA-binding response OmpR family regulator